MKKLLSQFLAPAALLALAILCPAQPADLPPNVAPTAEADSAFADFEAFQKSARPAEVPKSGPDFLRWADSRQQETWKRACELYAAFPNDPRCWEALLGALAVQQQIFVKDFRPGAKGDDAIIRDETAWAAWRAQFRALKGEVMSRPEVPATVRQRFEFLDFMIELRVAAEARKAGQSFDYEPLAARFDAFMEKYAGVNDTLRDAGANIFLRELEKNEGVEGSLPILRHLSADARSEALRQKAASKVSRLTLGERPLEMKFTAVDGRAVDLTALRGKVVLVDFWATWCGPCVAELPNVKKVYTAYRDKGFEVVGITLENAKVLPKDTAEQIATKLDAARKALADFTAKENMPWPQYFDGKFWQGDFATKYAVLSIPAMFLLDQNGMVVTTDARGEKLEAEVKRLLKL